MEIFSNISKIQYEGAKSKNPLSFKYYDADRVIMGKKMKDHLPFAMAWWHNLCACGVDMFGRGIADKSFSAQEGTMEHAKANGLKIDGTKVCGGGAKSSIWKRVLANVFGVPIFVLGVEEGPAYGAAILAMVGADEYQTVGEATEKLVKIKETVTPDADVIKKYEQKYKIFAELYPALKKNFFNMKELA